jgi:hypothetical protein
MLVAGWTLSGFTLAAAALAARGLMDSPPLSLTLMMGFTCLAIGLVVAVLVVGFLAASRKQQLRDDSEPDEEQKDRGG